MNKELQIESSFTKKDYINLINEATGNVINYTSNLPIYLKINNKKILANIKCNGVLLDPFKRNIFGKLNKLNLKFGFIIEFQSNDLNLVNELTKNADIDNLEYYLAYNFNIFKYISYNLYNLEYFLN